jgi:hypothetical protein
MQWEAWANTPDSSHSAIPLLLVMLYCLAWTIRRPWIRYALVLAVNFLSLFTGFGVFIGVVSILLLATRLCIGIYRRDKFAWFDGAALAVAIASAALFFKGYVFQPAVPDFKFPDPHPLLYPQAVTLALARICGVIGTGIGSKLLGMIIFILACAALLRHLPAACRSDRPGFDRSLAIVILIGFSMLFIADMAVGRISLGLSAIQASRYVTLEMTCLLGLYFAAVELHPGWSRGLALAAMLAASAYGGLFTSATDQLQMKQFYTQKRTWVHTFLATNSIADADSAAGHPLYPNPQATRLRMKLRYLRDNGLSFYHDLAEKTTQP